MRVAFLLQISSILAVVGQSIWAATHWRTLQEKMGNEEGRYSYTGAESSPSLGLTGVFPLLGSRVDEGFNGESFSR